MPENLNKTEAKEAKLAESAKGAEQRSAERIAKETEAKEAKLAESAKGAEQRSAERIAKEAKEAEEAKKNSEEKSKLQAKTKDEVKKEFEPVKVVINKEEKLVTAIQIIDKNDKTLTHHIMPGDENNKNLSDVALASTKISKNDIVSIPKIATKGEITVTVQRKDDKGNLINEYDKVHYKEGKISSYTIGVDKEGKEIPKENLLGKCRSQDVLDYIKKDKERENGVTIKTAAKDNNKLDEIAKTKTEADKNNIPKTNREKAESMAVSSKEHNVESGTNVTASSTPGKGMSQNRNIGI